MSSEGDSSGPNMGLSRMEDTITLPQPIVVQCGANRQDITPVEGETLTVAEIRRRLGDILNLAPNMLSVIGDEHVEEDRVVKGGETLQFIKPSGSKA